MALTFVGGGGVSGNGNTFPLTAINDKPNLPPL